jgi:hypothetical protein
MEQPDSLITETLSPPCGGVLISDSALKVVLSYYPVCRCQRTSPDIRRGKRSRTFQATKKLNLAIRQKSRFRFRCRDKIESNLQSQMYVERTPELEESRVLRGHNLAQADWPSRPFGRFFYPVELSRIGRPVNDLCIATGEKAAVLCLKCEISAYAQAEETSATTASTPPAGS